MGEDDVDATRVAEWDLLEKSMRASDATRGAAAAAPRASNAKADAKADVEASRRRRRDGEDDYGERSGGEEEENADRARRGRDDRRAGERRRRSRSREGEGEDRGRRRARRRSRSRSRDRARLSTPEREEERERKRQEREADRQRRELEKLDRDTRTVFVTNLSTKLDERGIFKFFSKVGKVTDVRIIYDRNTPKSKGMAYVEFADKKFIHPALELTGQELNGQAIAVKTSEAEKNIAWEAEQAQKKKLGASYGQGVPYIASAGPCKLRVGGLHRIRRRRQASARIDGESLLYLFVLTGETRHECRTTTTVHS